MHRWFVLVVTGLTALAALTAVSAAAPSERASAAAAGPAISSVSPKTLASGQRTTIKGRRFVTGKRRNTVVFLGRRGKRDDVKVKATATTTRKIVVKAPRVRLTAANARASAATQAVSGPLQVVNALGKSKASNTKVTFDEDKDGLSNEREIQLGTNPRKADTDGDGVRDGRDSDPLNPPAGGGGTPGGGSGGTPPPVPTDCPAAAVAGPGAGPVSNFEGLENAPPEARSLVSHTAVAGTTVYCLYRKKRSELDTAYKLVGKSTDPAVAIPDGGSPVRAADYFFRTDALTGTGVVAGSSALAARGAETITNLTDWAGLNQTCLACATSSVDAVSLKLAAFGTGVAGQPPVGSTAVYGRRLAFNSGSGEWVARVATPPKPDEGYTSANLTLSAVHPAAASTLAALTASGQAFINVELSTRADNSLHVGVTDSAGTVPYPTDIRQDLSGIEGTLTNSYLTVQPKLDGTYDVFFKTNKNAADVFVTNRSIPVGFSSGWLSLRAEMDSDEAPSREVRFDSIDVNAFQPTGLAEDFGGQLFPPPPPPPPAP